MSKKISRRTVLKGAAASGLGILFLRDSRLAFGYEANEKLNMAFIGVGGQGRSNLRDLSKECAVVAVCDTNDNITAEAAENHPGAQSYADFRVMLDKVGKRIDAVAVSTPDHTHAVAALMAIKMGKHVYCEKPLTRTLHEVRALRDAARKYKVATQMGNQGTASDGLRESVEIVRSGAIGQVFEVHVWSNRPGWPQGIDRPAETPPVPPELHWDLWLGPAPTRPYNPAYQPGRWRGFFDFGTGALGDMGCHTVNMPYMALDLKNPICVEADKVVEKTSETYPKQSIIHYSFPRRGNLRPLIMKWYDGGLRPSADLLDGGEMPESGIILIGDKGRLFSADDYCETRELLPKEKFANYTPPAKSLPRSPGHHAEFVRACKGGEPAMSNFDYAAGLTETILLGALAIEVGEPIYWDSESMKAINCPKADRYINPPYRTGWSL